MKIANVVCAWPPYAGGMANSAKQISDILKEQHDVTDFTPAHLKPLFKLGHGALMPQLFWQLRKYDYIYLHYPFFGTNEIIWLLKKIYRRPKLIIHYHMNTAKLPFPLNLLSWPSKLIEPYLFKAANLIVSASLDYVQSGPLKKYYLNNKEKFREIPFGLDIERFKPSILNRQATNHLVEKAQDIINFVNDKYIKGKKRQLLFVGGLDKAHYFKGVPILLEALAGIDRSQFNLEIVGEGDCRSDYEALVKKLNLSKNVIFSGKLNDTDLIRTYQKSDVFILPSINGHEAFGLVLIEAMACGVPVIASDLPGVRKVFNNLQEGLLASPGSIEELRKKIIFLLDHEDRRREMAKAARSLVEEKYSLNIMKEKFNQLFK